MLFELTKRTTGLCKNKKSGIISQNEMDSALVDQVIIISSLYYYCKISFWLITPLEFFNKRLNMPFEKFDKSICVLYFPFEIADS